MSVAQSVVPTSLRSTLTPADGLALLLAFGVFTYFGGPAGALAGLALVLVRFVTSALVTFTLGHLVLLGLVPNPAPLHLVLAELALVPFLFGSLWNGTARRRTLALCLLLVVALVLTVAGLTSWLEPTWQVAGVLVGTIAFIAYGIHRYERVLLGLVEEVEGTEPEVAE